MKTKIESISGTTANALKSISDNTFTSAFFKPYTGASNILIRTTSIITDPLILGVSTVRFALLMVAQLLKTFANLISLNFNDAKDDLIKVGLALAISIISLIAAVVSPIVNIVDLIGGGVNTLVQSKEELPQPQV